MAKSKRDEADEVAPGGLQGANPEPTVEPKKSRVWTKLLRRRFREKVTDRIIERVFTGVKWLEKTDFEGDLPDDITVQKLDAGTILFQVQQGHVRHRYRIRVFEEFE